MNQYSISDCSKQSLIESQSTPPSAASSSTDSDSNRYSDDYRLQNVLTPTKSLRHVISATDSAKNTANGSYWKEKALGRWRRPSLLSPKIKKLRRVRSSSAASSKDSKRRGKGSLESCYYTRKNNSTGTLNDFGLRNIRSEEQMLYCGENEDDYSQYEPDIIEKIKLRKNMAYQNKLKKLASNSPVHLLYQSWKETRGYSNSVSVFWNHMKFYFKTQFEKDDYVPFNPETYSISEEYEDIAKFECVGRAMSLDMKEMTPDWRKFLPSPPSSSGSKETRPEGAAKVAFGPRQQFEVQEFDAEAPPTACSRVGNEKTNSLTKGSLKPSSRHTLEDEKYCYRQTTEAVAYPHDCIRGLIYKLYNIVGYDTELADVNDLAFNLEVLAACIASNNKKVMKRLMDKNKESAFLRNSIRDLCYQINEMQVTIEELDYKVSQLTEKLTKERESHKNKVESLRDELVYFKNFSNKRFSVLINEQSTLISNMNKFFKESNYSIWNSDTQSVLRSFATTIDSRVGEFGIFHEMNKELLNENERLRKELNIYKDSPYLEKECQRLVAVMEEKNETISQLTQLKENYRELLVKKAAMQKELGVLRKHTEDLERQINTMEESHKKQLKELSKLSVKQRRKSLGFFDEKLYQEEIHSLEIQLEEARDKLLLSVEEITELHDKIALVEMEKNEINNEKKDIVESLMTAKAEFQQRELEHMSLAEQLENESEIKNRVLNKCLHIINRYQFELQSSNCGKKRDRFRTVFHYLTSRQKDLKEVSEWIETEVIKQINSASAIKNDELGSQRSESTQENSAYNTGSSSIYSTMPENTSAVSIQPFSPTPLLLTNFNIHRNNKEKEHTLDPPSTSNSIAVSSSGDRNAFDQTSIVTLNETLNLESAENHEMANVNDDSSDGTMRTLMDFRYGIDGLGAQKVSQLMKGRPKTGPPDDNESAHSASLKISENSGTMWANTDKSSQEEKASPMRFIELISSDDESF
ncbi:uncharacterized protein Ecym_7269 [Eremothecium cymbalariae DBVPG|uniref:Uncharacterized protein n=1 Tax=Eremothecium cymbalariae (strain CBS 270.75 / DBVPG 7215 / KCTC 17166 / NRRL Y-17582) TaxID=931890 RepID=G8JW98_ERECY|nr:hypothetical protein Ecym_7269 [Eremothecium cymbalariae DBVPG\